MNLLPYSIFLVCGKSVEIMIIVITIVIIIVKMKESWVTVVGEKKF